MLRNPFARPRTDRLPARSLTRRRTALALYSLLLVLPTLVLGGLNWYQLVGEQRDEIERVDEAAEAAARRLGGALQERVDALLAAENARKYFAYREYYFPDDLYGGEVAFKLSELAGSPAPTGVLGWFAYDLGQVAEAQADGVRPLPYTLLLGWPYASTGDAARESVLRPAVEALIDLDSSMGERELVTHYTGLSKTSPGLSQVVINLSLEKDLDCMRGELTSLQRLNQELADLYRYDLRLRLFRARDGAARVAATRLVQVDSNEILRTMPKCYANLAHGTTLVQGFLLDADWLFERLPVELAAQLLRAPELFQAPGVAPREEGEVSRELVPAELYGIEVERRKASEVDDADESALDARLGAFHVGIATDELLARHAQQRRRFGMVALMLLLTLGTGMWLLLRSVRQELEQARRTENFVAAVTHELRTPLAAVRLYGEMLRDGWVTSTEKQDEYYGRIVTEAHRLETMVERVLEKSRVTSAPARPEPGDANALLREVLEKQAAAPRELVLELAPDLGPVLLTRDGLRSIVLNLVENARKYAPLEGGREPHLVRTRVLDGRPVLEVLDRGPGVPDEDKQRIFQAFFRRGDEKTRTRRGTGLGLHLVRIHARAMGGDAEVLDREGGGSVFRVTLRRPGRDSVV